MARATNSRMFPSILIRLCKPGFAVATVDECDADLRSKMSFLLIIKRSHTFVDETDAAEWAAAVTSGDVVIFPIDGKFNEPEPIFATAKGGFQQKLIAFTQGFNFLLDNPDVNLDNMQEINANSKAYSWNAITYEGIAYLTIASDGEPERTDAQAFPTYESDDVREWRVTGNYRSRELPYTLDLPSAFFETIIPQ